MSVNNRIVVLRKTLRLSQEEFGKKIGLSRSAICAIENEVRKVSERNIKLIARTFDVSEEWLLSGQDEVLFKKWDKEMDYVKLHAEIEAYEQVQKVYGEDACKLLSTYLELNSKGQKKALDILSDLSLINKYKTTSEDESNS